VQPSHAIARRHLGISRAVISEGGRGRATRYVALRPRKLQSDHVRLGGSDHSHSYRRLVRSIAMLGTSCFLTLGLLACGGTDEPDPEAGEATASDPAIETSQASRPDPTKSAGVLTADTSTVESENVAPPSASDGDANTLVEGTLVRYADNRSYGGEALIQGRLEIDNQCLYVTNDGQERFPIVFPVGTSWSNETLTVTTPALQEIEVGDLITSGGSYPKISRRQEMEDLVGPEAFLHLASCVDNRYGEVAFTSNFPESVQSTRS